MQTICLCNLHSAIYSKYIHYNLHSYHYLFTSESINAMLSFTSCNTVSKVYSSPKYRIAALLKKTAISDSLHKNKHFPQIHWLITKLLHTRSFSV